MRIFFITVFAILTFAPTALAETLPLGGNVNIQLVGGGNTNTGTKLINPLGAGTNLPVLVNDIMKFVVRVGAIVVIFMLVYVGYLFVVARGNSGEIEAARKALLHTVIGALILLGAQVIAIGICETVNAISTGGSVVSCSPISS